MSEFLVIFSLTAVGSLMRWSTDLLLEFVARKTQGETIALGPVRSPSVLAPTVDPSVRLGFILAFDGLIVLALVSALPGQFALERTGLAFALLCVGGLIGEISSTGAAAQVPVSDADADAEEGGAAERLLPISRQLSLALTLVLNLSVAVLSSGQGLIEIVPPKPAAASRAAELDPVIVVARRTYDPLDERAAAR